LCGGEEAFGIEEEDVVGLRSRASDEGEGGGEHYARSFGH